MSNPSPSFASAAVLAACLVLPAAASAQNANDPPTAQRAHTLKSPPRDSKVLGGIQRGTDAAGRSIDHADAATRRGVNNTSERASRPIRHFGESLGRKLPGGTGRSAPPKVGPQGNAP
jgi:cytochrome c556